MTTLENLIRRDWAFCYPPPPPFLSVIFFASSILSKMLNFVILWEDRGFFRFFNFVKNAQFCHFLRSWCFFFPQFFNSSILSKILNFVTIKRPIYFFRFFNFVKNAQFCHFLRGPCIFFSRLKFCQKCSILSFCERTVNFFASSILSKMLNFVIS